MVDDNEVYVDCPECKGSCTKILDKHLSTHRDILFQCRICKYIIPIRIYKEKTKKLW